MGLGIKLPPALYLVLAQSRAKEKTQDGLMSLTAEGHMTLAMGTEGLPETFVGEVLGSQIRAQLYLGAPLWAMVREIPVPRGNF